MFFLIFVKNSKFDSILVLKKFIVLYFFSLIWKYFMFSVQNRYYCEGYKPKKYTLMTKNESMVDLVDKK